ncbi:MAG: hypothetical protein IT384_25140 [Deltaproteobacteria bacterium]|nr:hypothetical protein [Deltaproteobacteria bacterium]
MSTRAKSAFPVSLGVGALVACGPTVNLEPFPLEAIDDGMATPTGILEDTDALGLAYAAFEAHRFMSVLLIAADQIPGIRRSGRYAGAESSHCADGDEVVKRIDYACLGHPAGRLELRSVTINANDNGDYRLELSEIDVGAGDVIDGSARLRVEGVANPTIPERSLLAPVARLGGFPDFFSTLQRVAVRVFSQRGSEGTDGILEMLGRTYAFQIISVEADRLRYTLRDARNVWTCRSEVSGRTIGSSECRTPAGQGDYAVFEF